METHIPLVVRNVSLDDDETVEQLALSLSDLGWHETGGQVIATVYTTSPDPVTAAAAAALSIKRVLPQAVVERVDEQFVTLADIAARAGLSHEAVRLWAAGKRRTDGEPFPAPRAQVGQGRTATKIWAWPAVLAWLKVQFRLDLEPGTAYLTAQQAIRLNALLQERQQPRWQPLAAAGVTRTLAEVDSALEESTSARPAARRFKIAGFQR
ncbi:hypothetical protein DMH26_18510 [Streptomyces sp. WAC 05379]|uniref:hypothetical protein n=1 Tax=Streptomyces sp. WAC 05379 TaxID=2203207 RepID=UPI000F73EC67|nr:hypothetical protein [Streptomyces sp. WAC 05379]RSN98495.1 hypothetical protein DMH26_18510 [Streptomyces sp. WAC 05379]